ncbi:MAG: exonuclease SbcCD subunit D [Muribaculaceae bacterium]|nr:exonuclease SbcCD subunit D [Muribaculaceae bacterium]
MKIIHTSDWHIGQSFYNYSRDEEHRHFAKQLANEITRLKPDVLVVAGDIFDVAVPSIQAQRLLVEILTKLHAACPSMKIVLIAGNHDSASRLDIHAPLWHNINVEIIAGVNHDNLVNSHIIKVKSLEGKLIGNIVAVPYIAEYNYSRYGLSSADTDESAEKLIQNFHQYLLDVAQKDNVPIIMTAHLAVAGAEAWSHDQSKLTYHSVDIMGKGYDYLALGHIHHPSTIAKDNSLARYCGSPFKLSFDEEFNHSVSVVSVDSHGDKPEISEIEISPLYKSVKFPETPTDCQSTLELLKNIQPSKGDYIRIDIVSDKPVDVSIRHKIEEIVNEKGYRFCLVNTIPSQSKKPDSDTKQSFLSAESIRKANPIEIARNYYAIKYNGQKLPQDVEKCLQTAINLSDTELREENV